MAGGANSALGAVTVVAKGGLDAERKSAWMHFTMPGDADYKTGGTAGLKAALAAAFPAAGLEVLSVTKSGLNGGLQAIYDNTNDKLILMVESSGVELAQGQDKSATTLDLIAYFK